MQAVRNLRRVALGLLVLAALGACGGDGGGTATLSDAQALAVGDFAAVQLRGTAASLIRYDYNGTGRIARLFAPPRAAGRRLAGLAALGPSGRLADLSAALLQGACYPTLTDPTDSDADGVPDDGRLTWDCSYSDSASGFGYTVTGTVRVEDLVDAASGHGSRTTFDRFTYASTFDDGQGGTGTFSAVLDGTFIANVTGSSATATENMSWVIRENGVRTLRAAWDWTVAFDPDTTIKWANFTLPSGTLEFDGGFSFSGDAGQGSSGDWAFHVGTATPLLYLEPCYETPPLSFGAVRATLPGHGNAGFEVAYNGCGAAELISAIADTD